MKILLVLLFSVASFAQDLPFHWVTVGTDTLGSLGQKGLDGVYLAGGNDAVAILQVRDDRIANLSHIMHEEFNRCSGFMAHESYEEAIIASTYTVDKMWADSGQFVDYTIDSADLVVPMISMVEEVTIRGVIESLTQFHNRFYTQQSGVDSQVWLKDLWSSLLLNRNDASVEFFDHPRWPQPSLVATIKGSTYPDEIIVIGGHADSVKLKRDWMGQMVPDPQGRAPGADDNASGIATITEVLKVLVLSGYQPERTVKFIAYAAEEVGLLGSQEVARDFKENSKNVIGVLQLDMTNHKGTDARDIVMMSDFTNKYQNEFIGALIDTYLQIPWGYSKCGYGCSDHASWHKNGYPASMPFESDMRDINRTIHSENDTLAVSGGTAIHATKFAMMAVAFMVELAK